MLGDAVGGPANVAVLRENMSCRVEDPLPGLCGPVLCRLLTGPKSVRRGDGFLPSRMRVVNHDVNPQN